MTIQQKYQELLKEQQQLENRSTFQENLKFLFCLSYGTIKGNEKYLHFNTFTLCLNDCESHEEKVSLYFWVELGTAFSELAKK